ncbi:MAG: DUF2141 domain-containing protein [Spirochaetales bacterium]|nr:DUF2141 domain-containing protein [Spirochaetales bacterium]
MKKSLFILLFMIICTSLYARDWVITIKGIQDEKGGDLLLAVYPGEEGYMDRSKIIHHDSIPITSDKMTFVVKDLPPGEYAFAILHDENGDGEMEMGMIMPKEGFAFSGQKQPAGKPPKYRNAYVVYKGESLNSSAVMKYY